MSTAAGSGTSLGHGNSTYSHTPYASIETRGPDRVLAYKMWKVSSGCFDIVSSVFVGREGEREVEDDQVNLEEYGFKRGTCE